MHLYIRSYNIIHALFKYNVANPQGGNKYVMRKTLIMQISNYMVSDLGKLTEWHSLELLMTWELRNFYVNICSWFSKLKLHTNYDNRISELLINL